MTVKGPSSSSSSSSATSSPLCLPLPSEGVSSFVPAAAAYVATRGGGGRSRRLRLGLHTATTLDRLGDAVAEPAALAPRLGLGRRVEDVPETRDAQAPGGVEGAALVDEDAHVPGAAEEVEPLGGRGGEACETATQVMRLAWRLARVRRERKVFCATVLRGARQLCLALFVSLAKAMSSAFTFTG
ncbi:hypothetical protein ACCO45_002271 [Purpureocillium lilacinum]|uniref:Uncharacterized protein n=1 Tax=Purpureocillium lilacinum TaxID=33203 RepID=A0ACC4EAP7_PURLI